MTDYLDADNYPTDEALKIIEEWKLPNGRKDIAKFFEFVKSLWWCASWGWHEEDTTDELFNTPLMRYEISTGGWSGNESLIGAMEKNWIIWHMTWVQSRRGGHYIFENRILSEESENV